MAKNSSVLIQITCYTVYAHQIVDEQIAPIRFVDQLEWNEHQVTTFSSLADYITSFFFIPLIDRSVVIFYVYTHDDEHSPYTPSTI